MSSHAVGYSKSTRAKCHGPVPCKNSSLPIGTLRYGETTVDEFSQTVEWRHWGCVTPAILERLAIATVNNITGFQDLKPSDQQKIRLAISLRRIDPADIPETAKSKALNPATPNTGSGPTSLKRKAPLEVQPVVSQHSTPVVSFPSASQAVEEEIEEDSVDEEVKDEIYCTMATNVVGIQYYKGLVGPGEEVLLVREPSNPYDRNAIQVKNIGHVQVGHLPRNVASKLATLMDRQLVTVEGVVNDGNLSGSRGYTLSLRLKIFGPSDKRNSLEPLLGWATPGQRGFPSRQTATSTPVVPASVGRTPSAAVGPSQQRNQTPAQREAAQKQQEALQKAAELRQMLSNLEKVDDEGRRGSLLDTLCSTDDVLSLPLHPNPPSLETGELTVNLMRHQLQALQWCIERENPVLPKKEGDKPVQFWQLRKNGSSSYYYNIATKTPQTAPPALGRGALCADAMGLGKTLTMISLIIATKKDNNPGFSKTTLIVAPLSVLSNWDKQIKDHCTPGTLSTCVYYDTNRSMSSAELHKFDVVITTYQIVAGEHADATNTVAHSKKKKKLDRSLFEVNWKRIILDEGHVIRNPKTKMARAVVALNADRRWVLTGTPIINSPRDLGSLLTFLQICRPLDNEDFYKRLLLRPLKNGEAAGVELLRALMSHICIRRTKEMQDANGLPLIPLPPVEMIKVPVALNEEARRLYDEVQRVSQQRFENFINRGANAVVQSNVLSMLTRMRQIALHPGLVPQNYLEELRNAEGNDGTHTHGKPLSPEEKLRLQEQLGQAIEDCEECPICFSVLDDARITNCAHMFCFPCITEVISRDPKCPMDRRPLTLGDLYERLPPTDLTQKPVRVEQEENPVGIRAGSSAKIDQLIHLLKLTPTNEKSLVFSQFTSFLDKIAETMDEEGIPYVRFDGQMSAKRRQETLASFSVPAEDAEPIQSSQDTTTSRRKRVTRRASLDDDDFPFDSDDDDDFVMEDVANDDDDEDLSFAGKKGKGKSKATVGNNNTRRSSGLASKRNPRVMLISLKAGALGLNLTVANNVYLMDPWWQEGIESQAVDRVNRIGQKKNVHVYQLIAEDTMESKVLEIQERKKQLIEQAFSGIKRTETVRQQREARLQDLVELFGIRRQTASQAA